MNDSTPRRLGTAIAAPLFDRLIDEAPYDDFEQHPRRDITPQQLRASIAEELRRLFSTRSPMHASRASVAPGVINYGLADFGYLSPRSARDQQKLVDAITSAVTAYEPRLRNVSVVVEGVPGMPRDMRVLIEGRLVVDEVREAVSFPFVIQNRQEGAVVDELV